MSQQRVCVCGGEGGGQQKQLSHGKIKLAATAKQNKLTGK